MPRSEAESPYAILRLAAALLVMTLGGSSMYVIAVALPPVQAEFAATRAEVSLPYMLTMLCYGFGGIWMGRLGDRFGVVVPLALGAVLVGSGYVLCGLSQTLWQFTLSHSLLLGLGSSAAFGPLIADTSFWFHRHRGMAMAIAASGNYVAGAVWPPVMQHFFESAGWRTAFIWAGVFSVVSLLAASLLFRRRRPALDAIPVASRPSAAASGKPLGLPPNVLMALLGIAGISCCVAMSMPQVHIVAYCSDLGYGAARGAEMLALMFGCGIFSRLVSGWISDRFGGLRTLLLGSALQALSLFLFLPFDGLGSLYAVSALFGLVQGGIVPAYAVIVREYFSPAEAGARVGFALMMALFGMALGGWMSGAIFDLTGSYRAAFLNGLAFNALNLVVVLWLLRRARRQPALLPA